jgi:L-amino acid N-acyltransferase YncA
MIIRRAMPDDADAMAEILNRIIDIGGTTAHQTPKSADRVRVGYIDGPDVLSAVVAEDRGRIIGWQSVSTWQAEAHIGTFVRPDVQAKGAGSAMFALTCTVLQATGHRSIIASIRGDNVPGLAYYARLGFVDVAQEPDFALKDGTIVGRVHRRFDLV